MTGGKIVNLVLLVCRDWETGSTDVSTGIMCGSCLPLTETTWRWPGRLTRMKCPGCPCGYRVLWQNNPLNDNIEKGSTQLFSRALYAQWCHRAISIMVLQATAMRLIKSIEGPVMDRYIGSWNVTVVSTEMGKRAHPVICFLESLIRQGRKLLGQLTINCYPQAAVI